MCDEFRINSYNEIWCKSCSMLIHACTYHLTGVNNQV